MEKSLKNDIKEYYSKKYQTYKNSVKALGWNTEKIQRIIFKKLLKIIPDFKKPFTINDYGCGFGDLNRYLLQYSNTFTYYGYDLMDAMIQTAKTKNKCHPNAFFFHRSTIHQKADYSVTSGIFNYRKKNADKIVIDFIQETLHHLWKFSHKGIAFNGLTTYNDVEKRSSKLFYIDPCYWFDYCQKHFNREIVLLHDDKIFQFTILVNK